MRRQVWAAAWRLLPTAYVSWPFAVLPLALWLTACSLLPGHSQWSGRDRAGCGPVESLGWREVLAALSPFFLPLLPVVGLLTAAWVYRLNRRTTPEAGFSAALGLVLSAVAHLTLGVLLLFDPAG